MKRKQDSYIGVMIVPPRGGRSFNLKIPMWAYYGFFVALFLSIVLLAVSFYISTQYSADLQSYNELKLQQEINEANNKEISRKIELLQEDINLLIEEETEIQTMLGSSKSNRWKRNLYRKSKKKQANIKKKTTKIIANTTISDKQRHDAAINFLKQHIEQLKVTISKLSNKAERIRDRFSSTPSIWPVYGYIKSGYGWRTHPITGKRRLHKGIDIPAWRGAPIKATADGIVSYSGWSGTFGNVVVLKHRYGFRTIYAHCTQLLVKKRQYVKKGEVIAQVGSTGLSTGSHLHYEVMKWNKSIQPRKFLDLDMFTASAKVW